MRNKIPSRPNNVRNKPAPQRRVFLYRTDDIGQLFCGLSPRIWYNVGMKEGFEDLPETYWRDTMTRIRERFTGEKPSPMQIRAAVIFELAGIPSGQYSTLKTQDSETDEAVRTNKEGDKIVAENITNKAGLLLRVQKESLPAIYATGIRTVFPMRS